MHRHITQKPNVPDAACRLKKNPGRTKKLQKPADRKSEPCTAVAAHAGHSVIRVCCCSLQSKYAQHTGRVLEQKHIAQRQSCERLGINHV